MPGLLFAERANGRVGVKTKMERTSDKQCQPAVTQHLRNELGQQIEKAIDGSAGRQRANFSRQHRLEKRGVEVGRYAIPNRGFCVLQLREKSVVLGGRDGDGSRNGAHQIAHSTFHHIGRSACPLGPEAVSWIVRPAQNHRYTFRGRLGADKARELNTGDSRHPQIRDHD